MADRRVGCKRKSARRLCRKGSRYVGILDDGG